MKNRWLAVFALIAALGLLMPSLMAQGRGKAKGKQPGQQQDAREKDMGKDRDRDRDEGWERRDGFESRIFGDRDSRPPGWSRGKKTGWGNCGLPPGQAKKKGECRTYVHEGHRYYYYHDDDGRMIVRRPTWPAQSRK